MLIHQYRSSLLSQHHEHALLREFGSNAYLLICYKSESIMANSIKTHKRPHSGCKHAQNDDWTKREMKGGGGEEKKEYNTSTVLVNMNVT